MARGRVHSAGGLPCRSHAGSEMQKFCPFPQMSLGGGVADFGGWVPTSP